MKLGKLSASGILALSVVLAGPAAAYAQNCLGMPIANQKSAVSLSMAFPEEAKTFGISGRMRLDGPLSMGAGYTMTSINEVDPKVHNFGVDAAYEIPVTPAASVCGVVGVEHSSISDEGVKFSDLTIPIGVGIGKSFPAGNNAELVPYAVPQLLWTRSSVSAGGVSVSDSSADFGLNLGATYRLQQLMLRAGVTITSIEGDKATFGVGIGYAL